MPIEFYFDFVCPYAYLASLRVEQLGARANTNIDYRPVLLGGIYRSIGAPDVPASQMSSPRLAYQAEELQRLAKEAGVTLTFPEGHPRRSVLALRAALAAGDLPRVTAELFDTYWQRGEDLEDEAVVLRAIDRAGGNGSAAIAAAKTDVQKAELRRRTDEAVALGMFGVPSFVVRAPQGPQLFWGGDRMREVLAAARPAPALDFYFDYASPFAYLAAMQVRGLALRTNAKLRYRPILLGGLFRNIGTANVPLFEMSQPKQRYVLAETQRFADNAQIPFRFPSRFPMNTVKPLRLTLACPAETRGTLVDHIFRALWQHDRDISDDEVLCDILRASGHDAELLAATQQDNIKEQLKKTTQEAELQGIFGVPTFCFAGHTIWGQDQLDRVEKLLNTALE